jgi:hypothetical protein
MTINVAVSVDAMGHRRGGGLSIPTSGPPINLAIPTISGTPEQFQTLTVDRGVWGGELPITYTYQWYREAVAIAGATATTYQQTYLDVDYRLKCRVTATNAQGSLSVDTGFVGPVLIVQVALPSIASMFFAFEPGDPSSTYITLDQTFAIGSVDVAGNKLSLTGLNFPEFVQTSEDFKGAPVYFSTTGVLPAPLAADTPYYLSEVSGGYAIYPETITAHHTNMPTQLAFETPMRAQNYIERTNRIVLTDVGSGTHRVYSDPLVSEIYDRLGTGVTIQNRNLSTNDRHSALRMEIDGNGRHVVSREIARSIAADDGGSYNLYGPSPIQGPSSLRNLARAKSANRRVVWSTHVARVIPNNNRNVRKNIFSPSMVSTSTGIFNYTNINGRFATGDMVKFKTPPAGNTIPTGFTAGTSYYVRIVSGGTFTLHPTALDATNNTNIIIPSTQGTGKFVVYAPQRVGDFHRQIFFQEWLEPNGGQNTISPYVFYRGPTSSGLINAASAITIVDNGSSPENGDIAGLKSFGNLTRIEIWFADEAVRPVRLDTGLPLADGYYYVTEYIGGSSFGRLHDTLVGAQACVGVATTSCSSTNMIKFDGVTAPIGEFLAVWANNKTPFATNADWTSTASNPFGGAMAPDVPLDFTYMLPVDGAVHTFTFLVDNNDPDSTTPLIKLYIDGVLQHTWATDGVKGNSDATYVAGGSPAWTWLNSAALHVPFTGDIYATYMGGSTTNAVTDAEILALHDYTFDKFNVSQGSPVPLAPSNTVLPVIQGTLLTGQTLLVTDGNWAEYPVGTKTYQWTRNGSNIVGATLSSYLQVGADADQMIGCKVTSTNASGTATATAADVGPIVGVPAAPTVITAGTISGNVNEGFTLTLTPTTWSGYPSPTVAIQWKRDGVAISGANSTTYVTVSADATKNITCTETATNASGSQSSTSNSLGPIIAAPSFEAESNTLFARMSPAPSAQLKFDINTFIKALKDASVWTKLDMLQVYAVPDSANALLDWKTSSRTASIVTSGGAPGFAADRGFIGTVFSGGGYIDTGYNSVTFAGQFAQNSAHRGAYVVQQGTDLTGANAAILGVTRAYLIPRTNGSFVQTSVLNNTANNYTESGLGSAIHHYCDTRAASTGFDVYRDGAFVASKTSTSASPTSANMKALSREGSTTVSCHRIAIVHAGSALTAQNIADFYAAARAYLIARGVTGI